MEKRTPLIGIKICTGLHVDALKKQKQDQGYHAVDRKSSYLQGAPQRKRDREMIGRLLTSWIGAGPKKLQEQSKSLFCWGRNRAEQLCLFLK